VVKTRIVYYNIDSILFRTLRDHTMQLRQHFSSLTISLIQHSPCNVPKTLTLLLPQAILRWVFTHKSYGKSPSSARKLLHYITQTPYLLPTSILYYNIKCYCELWTQIKGTLYTLYVILLMNFVTTNNNTQAFLLQEKFEMMS